MSRRGRSGLEPGVPRSVGEVGEGRPERVVEDLLRSGAMDTRRGGVFEIHGGPRRRMIGDTRGLAGYLYVAAWLTRGV